MITIKNSKGDICDYRVPYNVNIEEDCENFKKIIKEINKSSCTKSI